MDDSITEHQTKILYNKFNSSVQWHDSRLLEHPSIMVASEASLNGFGIGTEPAGCAVCEENLIGIFLRFI